MEADFWHERWKENDIGFHLSETNPLLLDHFSALDLKKGERVFLPLCGKTLDIHWLLSQGYRVAGAELSELAVTQLFVELGVEPEVVDLGAVKHFSAEKIDIFVGNIFDLDRSMLGEIDAVYDRAALVALNESLRSKYSKHLMQLTNCADQLLFCFEYDQSHMAGPPFSISHEEVKQHYESYYDFTLVNSVELPEGLKGKCAATEHVWVLNKK